jgi:hypothetical protein
MKDRLADIIGNGAEAFARLSFADQDWLLQSAGSMAAARAQAWGHLPERDRVAMVRAAGAVPADCGDDIAVAPARGPVRAFDYLGSYPDGAEGSKLKPAGFLGRKTLQCADVFDRMRAQALRRAGTATLTASQIGMARQYRTLVEDRAAGAVRCSSMEAARSGGGGTREGFTEHRLKMSRRIDKLQARIGGGVAMAVRRVRPSDRGDSSAKRGNICDRALVDAVCLQDLDISAVLRAHGWSVYGDTVKAATVALASALDRMIGPVRRSEIVAVHFGAPPASLFKTGIDRLPHPVA